jgi:hypothetical protein
MQVVVALEPWRLVISSGQQKLRGAIWGLLVQQNGESDATAGC